MNTDRNIIVRDSSWNPLPKFGRWLAGVICVLIVSSAIYVECGSSHVKVEQKVTKCKDCISILDTSYIRIIAWSDSTEIYKRELRTNKYRHIDGYELTTYCKDKDVDYISVVRGSYDYIDSIKCIEYNTMKDHARKALARRKNGEKLLKELNDKKCR